MALDGHLGSFFGLPRWLSVKSLSLVKNLPVMRETLSLIPGRSSGGGNGNPH